MKTPPVHTIVTRVGSHLLVECSLCGPVGVFPSSTSDADLHDADHENA